MANQEHLDVLERGVKIWNQWREEHSEIEPDLYAMFVDFSLYHWVLPIHFYKDQTNLLATLKEKVIEPAEQKAQELEKIKSM